MLRLLAIETSCDETAAAILSYEDGMITVLGEAVSSQIALHAQYGGVVPNLAAREHVRNIVPIVTSALREATLIPADIDGLAVTQGPGLIPALLVGATAAKTLALAWNKPLLGINHLEGHIYANLVRSIKDETLAGNSSTGQTDFQFPLLALIVSGGHTQLVLMRDHFQYELLGETEDDAAGEAFDKVAKMLSLPYPGGPEVSKRADTFRQQETREAKLFPRPLIESNDYRFSFSGLKTAVLYFLKNHPEELKDEHFVAAIAHEFQEAVVDVLVTKTERAIQEYQPKTLVIAGGVSANNRLREQIETMVKRYSDCTFRMPQFKYSLDNAVMIGAAGILRLARLDDTEKSALKNDALHLEPSAHFPLATPGLKQDKR
jgi:N6-L-threonylcarbamoyladenine synthase